MKFSLLLAVIIQLAVSIFPASCLEYFPCMIFFLVDPGQFRIAKKKSSKTKTFLLGGISTINLPVLRVNLRAWETREWNKTRRRNSRADYSPPRFASGGQKSFFSHKGMAMIVRLVSCRMMMTRCVIGTNHFRPRFFC